MAPKLFRELARSDVIPTAHHLCPFLGSPHRTMAGASARSGEGIGSLGFAVGAAP